MAIQYRLKLLPADALEINKDLAFSRDETRTAYHVGGLSVFSHENGDKIRQRLAAVQLIEAGLASKEELSSVLEIDRSTLYRSQVRVRREGIKGLLYEKSGPKGGHRLRGELLERAQRLLSEGRPQREVGRVVGVGENTIRNAIKRGRLALPASRSLQYPRRESGSQPGERSTANATTPLGIATTRVLDRALAAAGKIEEAPAEFTPS